jgi:hypothetical protein
LIVVLLGRFPPYCQPEVLGHLTFQSYVMT